MTNDSKHPTDESPSQTKEERKAEQDVLPVDPKLGRDEEVEPKK